MEMRATFGGSSINFQLVSSSAVSYDAKILICQHVHAQTWDRGAHPCQTSLQGTKIGRVHIICEAGAIRVEVINKLAPSGTTSIRPLGSCNSHLAPSSGHASGREEAKGCHPLWLRFFALPKPSTLRRYSLRSLCAFERAARALSSTTKCSMPSGLTSLHGGGSGAIPS